MPLGAYAPVRYTSTGTKISLDCARASCMAPTPPAAASAMAAALILMVLFISSSSSLMVLRCFDASVRERPEPQLFLADRPEAREPARLHDQEEYDERPEDHEFYVRDHCSRQRYAEPAGQLVQHQRQDHDEGGAEERSQDRAQAADDHHEQQLERA